MKGRELLVFSIIHKKLNQITENPSIQLSWFAKKLIILWLFLPFLKDTKLVKERLI